MRRAAWVKSGDVGGWLRRVPSPDGPLSGLRGAPRVRNSRRAGKTAAPRLLLPLRVSGVREPSLTSNPPPAPRRAPRSPAQGPSTAPEASIPRPLPSQPPPSVDPALPKWASCHCLSVGCVPLCGVCQAPGPAPTRACGASSP